MENENLFNRVRELVQDANDRDVEWDSDRFWNMLESKKRKQQTRLWLSYASAAILFFVIGFSAYRVNTNEKLSIKTDLAISNISTNRHSVKAPAGVQQESKIENIKQQIKTHSIASKRNRKTARRHPNPASQPYQMNMGTPGNISMYAQTKHEISSFEEMREAAKRERALRELSVKLDDNDGYNYFWLTVNQQVLANKFSGDKALLHYEMPNELDQK